ncbi:MAG TPA: GNAT family N-acetyltransferase [Actinobacteria bacterium]|nr:GNAT family N-acetyltransferase [Actinomycetota bacterium]
MVEIRPATTGDIPAIVAFTTDTFDWGDYIPEVLPRWIDDDEGILLVAVEDERPIGIARGELLSPTEAWFHAARVHPDHRGRGVAVTLAHRLFAWARAEGAEVGRLLVEDWNEPSIRNVTKLGMRPAARFHRAVRAVGEASVRTEGNGGRIVPARIRLAPSAEAQPAFTSWSGGVLGRVSRMLYECRPWTFRRLRPDDLADAAKREHFWEVGSGWALVTPADDALEVGWLETTPDEATAFLGATAALAAERRRDEVVWWLPDVDWLVDAARRLGAEIRRLTVYTIGLEPR